MDKSNSKEMLREYLKRKTEALSPDHPVGCTASDAAEALGLSRAVVSHYLNDHTAKGELVKINTRPVYFFHKAALEERFGRFLQQEYPSLEMFQTDLLGPVLEDDPFCQLIGGAGSLYDCIEQCKAAVTYPGNGLPILLQGPTGTGKSMIAQIMYEYAVSKGILAETGRFVAVNCADYTNNPELLLTNLFGYVKGAYTGAEKDTQGLIAQADGGILFLDEAHGLKAECQEKLFLFMDKGIYHQVGDNENWYTSQVRIIFATTEKPESVLTKTLLRRIPVIAKVPALDKRPLSEKQDLIQFILQKEAQKIGKAVTISRQAFRALMNYPFTGNVGQLKNTIQAACAKAFIKSGRGERGSEHSAGRQASGPGADHQAGAGGERSEPGIHVTIYNLPPDLIQFVSDSIVYADEYNGEASTDEPAGGLLSRAAASGPNRFLAMNQTLLEILAGRVTLDKEILLDKAISCLEQYLDTIMYDSQLWEENPKVGLINKYLDHICGIVFHKYGSPIHNNDIVALSRFLYDYVVCPCLLDGAQEEELQSSLAYLQEQQPRQFAMADELSHLITGSIDISLSQVMMLDLVLYLIKLSRNNVVNKRQGIILSHGYSTASSMADAVNQLLGKKIFDSIDMPLDCLKSTVVTKLKATMEHLSECQEVILLVDMGSLEEIHEGLEDMKGLNIGIINNTNTKLALEVGAMILQDQPLESMFEYVSQNNPYKYTIIENRKKEDAILTVCATGVGTAQKISDLLLASLPEGVAVTVKAYNYEQLAQRKARDPVFAQYNVLFIAGTHNPKVEDYRFLSLEELIENPREERLGKILKTIMTQSQMEQFYRNIIKNFSLQNLLDYLTVLNPHKITNQIEDILKRLQEYLNLELRGNVALGLYIHIGCLLERLITNKYITSYSGLEEFEQNHQDFILKVKRCFAPVENHYNVKIPVSEIGYIYEYIFSQG